jgi:hypothetical protein
MNSGTRGGKIAHRAFDRFTSGFDQSRFQDAPAGCLSIIDHVEEDSPFPKSTQVNSQPVSPACSAIACRPGSEAKVWGPSLSLWSHSTKHDLPSDDMFLKPTESMLSPLIKQWGSIMRIKAIAFATIAVLTASAAVAAAHPYNVCEIRLGADWHCSRTMVVVTTCHRS